MTDTVFRYITYLCGAALVTLLAVVLSNYPRFEVVDFALVGSITMGLIGSAGLTPLITLPGVRAFVGLQLVLFLIALVVLVAPII